MTEWRRLLPFLGVSVLAHLVFLALLPPFTAGGWEMSGPLQEPFRDPVRDGTQSAAETMSRITIWLIDAESPQTSVARSTAPVPVEIDRIRISKRPVVLSGTPNPPGNSEPLGPLPSETGPAVDLEIVPDYTLEIVPAATPEVEQSEPATVMPTQDTMRRSSGPGLGPLDETPSLDSTSFSFDALPTMKPLETLPLESESAVDQAGHSGLDAIGDMFAPDVPDLSVQNVPAFATQSPVLDAVPEEELTEEPLNPELPVENAEVMRDVMLGRVPDTPPETGESETASAALAQNAASPPVDVPLPESPHVTSHSFLATEPMETLPSDTEAAVDQATFPGPDEPGVVPASNALELAAQDMPASVAQSSAPDGVPEVDVLEESLESEQPVENAEIMPENAREMAHPEPTTVVPSHEPMSLPLEAPLHGSTFLHMDAPPTAERLETMPSETEVTAEEIEYAGSEMPGGVPERTAADHAVQDLLTMTSQIPAPEAVLEVDLFEEPHGPGLPVETAELVTELLDIVPDTVPEIVQSESSIEALSQSVMHILSPPNLSPRGEMSHSESTDLLGELFTDEIPHEIPAPDRNSTEPQQSVPEAGLFEGAPVEPEAVTPDSPDSAFDTVPGLDETAAAEVPAPSDRTFDRPGAPYVPAEHEDGNNRITESQELRETADAEPTTQQGLAPPQVKSQVAPTYPSRARRQGAQGSVLLQVDVDENGNPARVEILRSSERADLDAAAVEAVRKWKFYPALEGGRPVSGRVEITVVFQLR